MASLADGKTVFVIETLEYDNGMDLKPPAKDADGYYIGVPVMRLGGMTRNGSDYDRDSVMSQLDAGSTFHTVLRDGDLFGEWGHPFIGNMPKAVGLARLIEIDPKNEGFFIKRVYASDSGELLLADMKKSGPYGKYFEERMEDPTRNLSFSLRSICKEQVIRGTRKRFMIRLVTFDGGVAAGGYREASKRFSNSAQPATENLAIEFGIGDIADSVGAMESFSSGELQTMFGSKAIKLTHTEAVYDVDAKVLVDKQTADRNGLFHTLIRR
jgi:hypothetical protein